MPDDGFNGSTVTFAAASLGPLRDIRYSEAGGKADVTGSSDTLKTYEGGIPDVGVTVTVVGGVTVSKGDKGAVVVTWNDGGTDGAITNAMVDSVEESGSMDSEILSTVAFVPSTA